MVVRSGTSQTDSYAIFCQIPLDTRALLAYLEVIDKGKPVERWGRKTTGLRTKVIVYDSGVAR